jgi:streptogramin lyase
VKKKGMMKIRTRFMAYAAVFVCLAFDTQAESSARTVSASIRAVLTIQASCSGTTSNSGSRYPAVQCSSAVPFQVNVENPAVVVYPAAMVSTASSADQRTMISTVYF